MQHKVNAFRLSISAAKFTQNAGGVDSTDHPPAPPSPTSTDGWGEVDQGGLREDREDSDKEGWDDVDPLEELEPPAPASAAIRAAQKRPVVNTKPPGESTPVPRSLELKPKP